MQAINLKTLLIIFCPSPTSDILAFSVTHFLPFRVNSCLKKSYVTNGYFLILLLSFVSPF